MARLDPTGVSRILSYIKNWVTTALGGKANSSHNHTKNQITDFPTIPSSTSQLTNDSGFLTSHQDLSGYVPKSGGAVLNATSWSRTVDDDYLLLNGGTSWTNGAHIVLSGKNRADSGGGEFVINAKNDSSQYSLTGLLDGSLTWSGNSFYSNIIQTNGIRCDVPAESFYTPLVGVMAANDGYRIRAGGTNNGGELWIETSDDGNEPIGFAQWTGDFASLTRYGYLLNGSGNTEFPGTLFTYNGAIIRRNGIPTPGWGYDANTQSVLQIRTEDNTEPSICLHRSGYSHIVLAEQGGQFGVHAQGGTFDRCNTEANTVLNGYRIYVG